jgi:hypothetical protein
MPVAWARPDHWQSDQRAVHRCHDVTSWSYNCLCPLAMCQESGSGPQMSPLLTPIKGPRQCESWPTYQQAGGTAPARNSPAGAFRRTRVEPIRLQLAGMPALKLASAGMEPSVDDIERVDP